LHHAPQNDTSAKDPDIVDSTMTPDATAGPQKAPDASVAGGGSLGKSMRKVLAIDDTPEIRMIITETLNLFGFHTITAEDGATGIQLARESRPDLILCDINMPNLDGYETLRRLRDDDVTAGIPFVFLSGATDRITMRRGMELGADDYLPKPFTPKELLAAVNTRLEKQAELRRLSDRKLDELRGNITLALPHELRTPLNGIMGLAQLLIDDYANMPPEELLESSRFIYESALRLHRLIENFLVYSQIELMASESKTFDFSALAKPIQAHDLIPEIARKVASRHKREGDLLLKSQPATLLLPPDNFTKIVEELVDNAFKFSEPGKPVLAATQVANDVVVLTVTDMGRGMSMEQISRIAPHVQFDRKTFEQQGAGLGLYIAKRLIELLGGQIQIESKPGQQTSVRVSFRVAGI
jgi:signal transduction histidine kinase